MPDAPGWGLLALAFAGYAWPQADESAWAVKSAVLAVLLGCMAAWILVRQAGRAGVAAPALPPALALSGWMFVTLLWSLDPVRSFGQSIVVTWVLLPVVMSGALRLPPAFTAGLVLCLAGVESFAGAWQLNSPPDGVGGLPRLHGSFVNANHHAALLTCGFAAAAALCLEGSRLRAAAFMGLAFAFLASAALSGSRTVVAAAALALAGLSALRFRGWRLGLLVVLSVAALASPAGIVRRVADQAAGREPLPLARLDLWAASARMLRAHPLGGVGAGAFGDAFPSVRPVKLAHLATDFTHNEPLQAACELGLPGLGIAAWLLIALLVQVRFAGRFRTPSGRAAGAVLVPLGAFALFDYPLHVPALGFLVVACVAALTPAGGPALPARRQRTLAPVTAGIGALSLVLAAWICVVHAAEFRYLRGAALAREGRAAEAIAGFKSAIAIFGWHARSLEALAELEPGDPATGARLARAMRARPAWFPPVATSFERAIEGGDEAGARSALEAATRMDPNGLGTRLLRVRWLARTGELDAAGDELLEVEARWPDHLDVWLEKARLREMRGDREGALRALKRILSVFPQNGYVKRWMERLAR